MGMEYGIRFNQQQAQSDQQWEQWIMDSLHARLVPLLKDDQDHQVAYDHGKLAILQDDEKWPDVLNAYFITSDGDLEGTVNGERYLYLISYAGRALDGPWLQAIDELMEELMPGAVREEL